MSTFQLWRKARIIEETGLSITEIERRMKSGTFPNSIKIGPRSIAWRSDEIESWKIAIVNGQVWQSQREQSAA